ncbi:response regulator [Roseospira navarrensis]|uniref:Response regulator n=1 Tax=Roseospira navarrensis TaxID=140058 RepID=A0A7X1ZC86_9PROT|nr:response regulator [Roseospira navarrensis]MQX35893.1 response regulator [Roseospira navarrensis]
MAGYSLEQLTVLVVDDNAHTRAIVRTILGAFGVRRIQEAGNGDAAFVELSNFPADLVICDWIMAPVDGVAFVRMVRTSPESPNPFVPIIMLTGHTELSRVMEARDAGVHEFLSKPISATSLFARIKAIIDRPRPFVRTATYFGPDRRRHTIDWRGPERRRALREAKARAAGTGGLSRRDLDALLSRRP